MGKRSESRLNAALVPASNSGQAGQTLPSQRENIPSTTRIPATDSATELRPILGDDATAPFESDPNFIDSNPGENGSSENEPEQKEALSLRARDTDDTDDEDDEDEDDD